MNREVRFTSNAHDDGPLPPLVEEYEGAYKSATGRGLRDAAAHSEALEAISSRSREEGYEHGYRTHEAEYHHPVRTAVARFFREVARWLAL